MTTMTTSTTIEFVPHTLTLVNWKPSPLSFRMPIPGDKFPIFHSGQYDCGGEENSFAMIRVVS